MMKSALAVITVALVLFAAILSLAQTPNVPRSSPAPAPDLDAIVAEIQRATQSANADIAQLRIERWKAAGSEKAEVQKVADSVRKNISNAVPDLIGEVQTSHGSVSSAFKLYHNLNVLFEYLNSLTDAVGNWGKGDEYDPLSRDTAALNTARQRLSDYIEQAAASLEMKVRTANTAVPVPTPQPQATPKRIIVDDDAPPKKPATSKKKKTSAPRAQPASTPNQDR